MQLKNPNNQTHVQHHTASKIFLCHLSLVAGPYRQTELHMPGLFFLWPAF
jgi:hypothetical protein